MSEPERQYCIFMDGTKYNRNAGCRVHDNAYGMLGGGTKRDRRAADMALFRYMRANRDPLALVALYFTRVYGWAYFNYHDGWLWRGQLIRKIWPSYGQR